MRPAEGLLRFDSGVIGTLAAGWADVANPLTFQVNGTKACASIIEGKLHVTHKEKQLNAVARRPAAGLAARV